MKDTNHAITHSIKYKNIKKQSHNFLTPHKFHPGFLDFFLRKFATYNELNRISLQSLGYPHS